MQRYSEINNAIMDSNLLMEATSFPLRMARENAQPLTSFSLSSVSFDLSSAEALKTIIRP